MATIAPNRRQVKPASEDARGKCGLTLTIDGTAYRCRPISCIPGSSWSRGFYLLKQAGEGDVYDVVQTTRGTVECTCPDYVYRRAGGPTVCKHGAALVALGLLSRKGGAR